MSIRLRRTTRCTEPKYRNARNLLLAGQEVCATLINEAGSDTEEAWARGVLAKFRRFEEEMRVLLAMKGYSCD